MRGCTVVVSGKMESMLHLVAPSLTSLLDGYALPADEVPSAATAPAFSLPVIDLSHSRDKVSRAILDAGREFGFFQVVNHGVSEQAIQEMDAMCDEFFELPAADKAHLFSEDRKRPNRLFSGSIFKVSGKKYYWMDCLRLERTFPDPVGDSKNEWPDKPQGIRDVVDNYMVLVRGLGMELLQIMCEGMGLRPDYFHGDLSGGNLILSVNSYPPCPNPAVTLGLPPHYDRNLITLVRSNAAVQSLEVCHNGDWIKVDPIPNAFVVNFGLQLEVVTNGFFKSVEHRVASNSVLARKSIVTAIIGTQDCIIGPAEELVSEDNPPRYRTIKLGDFLRIYTKSLNRQSNNKDLRQHMEPLMI